MILIPLKVLLSGGGEEKQKKNELIAHSICSCLVLQKLLWVS